MTTKHAQPHQKGLPGEFSTVAMSASAQIGATAASERAEQLEKRLEHREPASSPRWDEFVALCGRVESLNDRVNEIVEYTGGEMEQRIAALEAAAERLEERVRILEECLAEIEDWVTTRFEWELPARQLSARLTALRAEETDGRRRIASD